MTRLNSYFYKTMYPTSRGFYEGPVNETSNRTYFGSSAKDAKIGRQDKIQEWPSQL